MRKKKDKLVNREYKDTVFTDLFYSDETAMDNLLGLVNALLGTQYTTPEVLQKVRLEDALMTGQKNDVAVTVANTQIVLCEHQSTVNYNMPVRLLQYIANEYEQYLTSTYGPNAKYQQKRFTLPNPRFFVLYNGEKEQPVDYTMRLSDAYEVSGDEPELELTVRIININYLAEHHILEQCNVLHQYSQMVEIVRTHLKQGGTLSNEKKVTAAIRECIQRDILKTYLLRKESEVVGMLSTEYNYELNLETRYEEGIEKGAEEQARTTAIRMYQKGMDIANIADCVQFDIETVKGWLANV